MTRLLLARHGETDWNRERRWQGHADRPLNDTGRAQARALAETLAGRGIDAIHASDLLRARETAEIVGARLGLPVALEPGLREVDVGEWSGLRAGEAEARFPDGFRRWQAGGHGWLQGESYEEMGARVVATVLRLATANPGGTLLVVTHGGSIRACQAAASGLDYAATRGLPGFGAGGNCGLVELRISAGRLAPLPG
jgi:probable phosphoglycerate mutase